MKILIVLFMASLLLTCNNQEAIPDGGPCSYDSTVNPAKLISIIQKTV